MYNYILEHLFFTFTDLLLNSVIITPLVYLIIFFSISTFFLYYSLQNIFKIFFLTEILLLIVVIFLSQLAVLHPNSLMLNYFYCQLILASAAAEGALFLGLFSYLYEQQFSNWIYNSTSTYQFDKKKINK